MPDNRIDNKFLKYLVCPASGAKLEQEDGWLVCKEGKLSRRYPIKNSVPVILVGESEILDDGGCWIKSSE